MKINTTVKQGVLLVRVEGELDMHVADEFRNTLDEAIDASGVKSLVLNLKGVSFIDSSGLGVILGRYKRLNPLNGRISFVNTQPQVERILELSGLLRVMHLYRTEADALACL